MKILITGDFAPQGRLAKQIENRQFSKVFPEDIRDVIKSADFSFVNFESPIVENGYKPIPKCGPNLWCTKEAAEAVNYAGFTGVTMANNHILDFGSEGLYNSVDCCKRQGLSVVGVGDNLKNAEEILYVEKDGKTLAIINCCEHEFTIATETEAGANPLNPIRQFYAIHKAKNIADYVLVIVHGGHEMFQLPSPRMVETYRFFIDAGADAVVNHHQHCYSGYELYKGKPIFYGLGNFCFDKEGLRNCSWNEGYMVGLSFSDVITFNIYPYSQYGIKPTLELLDTTAFDNTIAELNQIISDSNSLRAKTTEYYKNCTNNELSRMEPYSGRILSKLLSLGLLPKFICGQKAINILNHVDCEAHRDKLIFALRNE